MQYILYTPKTSVRTVRPSPRNCPLLILLENTIPSTQCAHLYMSAGSDQPWLCWRSLNRLRTGIGRAKITMRRWGYIDNTQSVNCDCGEPQTMAHLLCCRLLDEPCSPEDLTIVTERATACASMWQHLVWRTRGKKICTCDSDDVTSTSTSVANI